MANFSFDIVSEVDLQEMDNAVNQANKELAQRYDFRESKSSIAYDRKEKKITLVADDDFKLRALTDILVTRMAKRSISLKSLKFNDPEKAFGGYLRQSVEICTGIDKEKAKELTGIIKKLGLKVKELGVKYLHNKYVGSFKVLKHGPSTLKDTLKIWLEVKGLKK